MREAESYRGKRRNKAFDRGNHGTGNNRHSERPRKQIAWSTLRYTAGKKPSKGRSK